MKYTVDESRTWYNGLPAKRSSAGMVIRHGDTILMVKDDYKSAMTVPGGVIDPDEAPRHAAIRETQEETGLELRQQDVQFLTMAYVPESHGFLDRYHFFFQTTISNESRPETTSDDSIEYFDWVPISEIADRAGDRPTYVALQHMLETGEIAPYCEVTRNQEGNTPWQT